jgi:hypothetical protein
MRFPFSPASIKDQQASAASAEPRPQGGVLFCTIRTDPNSPLAFVVGSLTLEPLAAARWLRSSLIKRLRLWISGRCVSVRIRPHRIYIHPKQTRFGMENQMSQTPEKSKGGMSVDDFAIWAGIGRTTAWNEIRDCRLRAVKIRARTIIRFADADNWLASRPPLIVPSTNTTLSPTTK